MLTFKLLAHSVIILFILWNAYNTQLNCLCTQRIKRKKLDSSNRVTQINWSFFGFNYLFGNLFSQWNARPHIVRMWNFWNSGQYTLRNCNRKAFFLFLFIWIWILKCMRENKWTFVQRLEFRLVLGFFNNQLYCLTDRQRALVRLIRFKVKSMWCQIITIYY